MHGLAGASSILAVGGFPFSLPNAEQCHHADSIAFMDNDMNYADMKTRKEIDNAGKSYYDGSPFEKLVKLSSKSKGTFFEMIVHEFLESNCHDVKRAESSDYDRLIDGVKTEIKGSTRWKGSYSFRWQQLRMDEDYDDVIFLAVDYNEIRLYSSSKSKLIDTMNGGMVLPEGCSFKQQHDPQHVSMRNVMWLNGTDKALEECGLFTMIGTIHG